MLTCDTVDNMVVEFSIDNSAGMLDDGRQVTAFNIMMPHTAAGTIAS
jgi:hypothetical protein